jgi:exosome complex RNA-binding protein Rrp42 (RNase PH superfamily)
MFSTISLNERDFILEAMKDGLRVGGRGLHDSRARDIKFGTKNG